MVVDNLQVDIWNLVRGWELNGLTHPFLFVYWLVVVEKLPPGLGSGRANIQKPWAYLFGISSIIDDLDNCLDAPLSSTPRQLSESIGDECRRVREEPIIRGKNYLSFRPYNQI
jgi:hypothetical protein